MKKTLLFFCTIFLIFISTIGRYYPVSLDLAQPTTMEVEIKGEVKKPGIYTVKWNASVKDLLNAAGGQTEQADLSAVSLVRTCNPNDVIVIPEKQKEEFKKISINTASLEQLVTLPGIGPSMAERIIEYRNEHIFQTIEDLMNVKGIGPKSFEKIKDRICL